MNRSKLFDRFCLDDHLVCHYDIRPKPYFQMNFLVNRRYRPLDGYFYPSLLQLESECHLINAFQKPRAKSVMNFEGAVDDYS